MIKNILFDIGNVLVNFKPLDYLNEMINDPILRDKLYKLIFCGMEWQKLDEGTITEEEAFSIFCSQCPEDAETIEKVKNSWYSILTPIDGTVEILHELKKIGYKTYLLSNYHLKSFDWIYKQYDFFKLFDGFVVSSHVNLLKPDPKIYEKLIEQYSIKPSETVFIDDIKINLEAAEKLGFITVQFENSKKLKEQLNELGVMPR